MQKLIAALALMAVIAIPTFTQTASAEPGGWTSPAAGNFGP